MNHINIKDIYNLNYDEKLKYLHDLYVMYFNYDLNIKIVCNDIFNSILNFILLPTKFILDEIYIEENNIINNDTEYSFLGINGTRNIFSNIKLPLIMDDIFYPIPFSFPVYIDYNRIKIYQSNVYYYEVTIINKKNIDTIQNESIIIGFGNNNTGLHNRLGHFNNSFGYNSNNGKITIESRIYDSVVWNVDDTVGAGIIYNNMNKIIPFFTFNGELIYMHSKPITIYANYFPIINYNHSYSIDVNFSNKKFLYDISYLIDNNSNYILSSNNSFIHDNKIEIYQNISPKIRTFPSIMYFDSVLPFPI